MYLNSHCIISIQRNSTAVRDMNGMGTILSLTQLIGFKHCPDINKKKKLLNSSRYFYVEQMYWLSRRYQNRNIICVNWWMICMNILCTYTVCIIIYIADYNVAPNHPYIIWIVFINMHCGNSFTELRFYL